MNSPTPATQCLFVYGTLMHEEILQRVSGISRAGEFARLYDFQRFAFAEQVFPGIVSSPGEVVEGLLYRDIPAQAMQRLDAYEGDWYQQEKVCVVDEAGEKIPAITYIVNADNRFRLSRNSWCHDSFVTYHLKDYLNNL